MQKLARLLLSQYCRPPPLSTFVIILKKMFDLPQSRWRDLWMIPSWEFKNINFQINRTVTQRHGKIYPVGIDFLPQPHFWGGLISRRIGKNMSFFKNIKNWEYFCFRKLLNARNVLIIWKIRSDFISQNDLYSVYFMIIIWYQVQI